MYHDKHPTVLLSTIHINYNIRSTHPVFFLGKVTSCGVSVDYSLFMSRATTSNVKVCIRDDSGGMYGASKDCAA